MVLKVSELRLHRHPVTVLKLFLAEVYEWLGKSVLPRQRKTFFSKKSFS
jgi:hypothetical protein